MSLTPYEIARQRQNTSKQEVEKLRISYEQKRIQTCIDYFNQMATKFVSFVEAHDYPCAELVVFEGQRCVGYPLYSTYSVEGELYFKNFPLTLLINEQGQVLYAYETAYARTGSLARFAMPTSYNEYTQDAELPYRKNGKTEANPGDDLLKWSAAMEFFMKGYQQYGYYEGLDYVNRWVRDNDEKSKVLKDIESRILTDGRTFEQYLSVYRHI